jgi:aromatic ring-cleaving dioxygenase
MRRIAEIASFHAHVYFRDSEEVEAARALREAVADRFAVQLGRWHDQAIGPHDRGSYQIAFAPALFASLVPWLMLNHGRLSILVHPNSGQVRRDHVDDCLWIGPRLDLIESVFPELEDPPEPAPAPNTRPNMDA